MVKRRVRPRSGVVALGAGLGKASRHVVGIGCALIILQMAGHACRAAQAEVVVDMAVGAQAWWDGVGGGEWEAHRGVIEVRGEPGIGAVAQRAVGGEAAGSVLRIVGRLEIRGVTGVALRRHGLELAGRSSLMAAVAIHGRVRAGQRKAIIVLLHLPYGYLPSPNGVALLAIRS